MRSYNEDRTHQGKICCGRTPRDTFDAGLKIWSEKKTRPSGLDSMRQTQHNQSDCQIES